MKRKRAFTLIILFMYILMLAGCWDARELDTLSIVAGVGIDTAPKSGQYTFSVEIGKAQKSKSDGQKNTQNASYIVLSTTGETMLEALEHFRFKSSREMFLHPNQVIVFGKDLASQGLGPVLDMFMRDHESRLEVWAIVADGKARDILSTDTSQEPRPAATIARMLENASGVSKYYGTKMIEFFSRLADKATSAIVPVITAIEENDSYNLEMSGSAVFQDDKMVGMLNAKETEGYVYAMGDVEDGILEVPMPEGYAILEISRMNSRSSPVLKDGKITIELNVQALLAVGELQGFKNKKMDEVMKQVEKAAAAEIVNEIVDTFMKTQSMGTDIYGYGLSIYKKYPKEWEKMKDDWENIYPGIVLELTVKTQLSNTGLITDSLEMRGAK